MVMDSVLDRFIKQSPTIVMARLALQKALEPAWINELFDRHRQTQYTRELLFSTTVEIMSVVAVGLRPSIHAAAQAAAASLPVSIAALYDKINHTEPALVRALVGGSAARLDPVVRPLREEPAATASGWRVRIVDGSHLRASDKRLKPLRGFRGAALPGQSLVVYDPDLGMIVDMMPCEDGHAQERSLMQPLLESATKGELWIADRNFSTRKILCGWHARGSAFIVREHGRNPNPSELERPRKMGRIDTGSVSEQTVRIEDEDGTTLDLRRIELQLKQATEDGDTIIRLLSNLPADEFSACDIAQLYRRRWKIEGMFQRLESVLNSEFPSLSHPRAALLAFGVAALAYNVLAVVEAAVSHQHRLDATRLELSQYFIAMEIKAYYAGMLLAVAAEAWTPFERMPVPQLRRTLLDIASHVDPRTLRKHARAPKSPLRKGYVAGHIARKHVSTARVLAEGGITS